MYKAAHTCIYVKDIEETKAFYNGILGFDVISEEKTEEMNFLYIDACGQTLELIKHLDREFIPRASGPIDHIAFYVDNCENEVERLKALKVKMLFDKIKCTNSFKIMFIEGPNGERIELMEKLMK